MKKLLCALFVCILVVSMTLPAMAAGNTPVDQLNIALNKQEGFLNPYTYSSETGYQITHLIYDSLFILDENLNVTPWLVEDYSYDADTLTYTFKLHDGVLFHDGEKLTADDVKFTFEFLQENPKSRFSQPAAVISEITVVDELTLTMTLSQASADFLDKPLCEMGILPEHIWSQVEDPNACSNAVGSGMFRVTEMVDGEYYILEKNENFWNGTVAVDMLYMPIIADASTRQTALLTGELDAATSNLSAEVIEEFVSSGRFNIYQGAGFPSTMMYFNCDRAPFDNVEFRHALSLAIDRQDIVDTVMLGYATPGTNSHVHPAKSYYDATVKEPAFDLDAANAILDELGYLDTNGDGLREMDGEALDFTIYVYANNTARIRIAELVKAWYQEIGVGITISALDMDTVDNIVWPGYMSAHDLDFDMVMWGWGASTMSASYVNRLWNSDLEIGTSNVGAFASDEVDALVAAVSAETDAAARDELMKDLQAALVANYPAYVFYYADLVYATSQKYDGWVFQNGAGIMHVKSFLLSDTAAAAPEEAPQEEAPAPDESAKTETPAPAAETAPETPAEKESSHSNTWVALLIPVAIIVVIAAVVLLKNKRKK